MSESPARAALPSRPRLDAPERMHGLLNAVMNLGRGLELSQVLRGIVEAAVELTDAEYGALGVIGEGQRLSQFLTVGIPDDAAALIGRPPRGRGILGELIRHPVPLRLTDRTRHPGSLRLPEHHPPMRGFLGVPIRVRDEVFGNLYLTEKRDGADFDADDEALLTTLAKAAGVAIDNARRYHDSRRREQWLEALGEIGRSLLAGTETRAVLGLIARRASELADADQAVVLLPSGPHGDRLIVETAHGPDAEHLTGLSFPAHGSLAGQAARTGSAVATTDAGSDPRVRPFGAGDGTAPYGPVVAVPLPLDAASCGALRLSRHSGRAAFDDTEVLLVSRFADQAALALELARRRAESGELAVLRERDRIARDLHDLAVQRLFATGMTLRSTTRNLGGADAVERVGRAVRDLDTTVEIIRTAIFELRSAGDDRGGAGLRRRMPETVRLAARSLGFGPALRIEGPVDSTVPVEVAEQVLAVTGEALDGIARHTGATRADVFLAVPMTGDRLTLTVTDDGTAPHGDKGPGLRSHAERYGGTLTVEPTADGGTRISWRIQLPAD
ncbi:histidine kinase [Streptomyces sp. SLBN-31]|nr:histidine kinase [Streptomyces sp. SLBN-31]